MNMLAQGTPSDRQIEVALARGGLDAVDDLFYPGDRARNAKRRAAYPKPNGTGRQEGKLRGEDVFRRPDHYIGERSRRRFFMDDVWIGDMSEIRRGFLSIHYRTHDGMEFAHAGGPTGAETYLIERYWLYGDPPAVKAPAKAAGSWLRRLFDLG